MLKIYRFVFNNRILKSLWADANAIFGNLWWPGGFGWRPGRTRLAGTVFVLFSLFLLFDALLQGFFFQRFHGFLNLFQRALPEAQFTWKFIASLAFTVESVFFGIATLRLAINR